MSTQPMGVSTQPRASGTGEFLILAGRPSMQDFVRVVRESAARGHVLDEAELAHDWYTALAAVQEVERSEPRLADECAITELPRTAVALAEEELKDPAVSRSLGLLPRRWVLAELDKIIVWQRLLDLRFAAEIAESIPGTPSIEQLIPIAAGRLRQPPTVQVGLAGGASFAFSSPSQDLRVLGAIPMDPADIAGRQPFGRPVAALTLYIGFSINFMMAVQFRDRIMLVNGTHRAFALRKAGVTHAPLLLLKISSEDEFDLARVREASPSVEWHFRTPRPPLLKDYFDDRLRKIVAAPRRLTSLQVTFSYSQSRIALD